MKIRSQQTWDDEAKKLVAKNKVMSSSPSARFCLVLNNHRLIYMHETPSAPGLVAFENTMSRFIRDAYLEYVNGRFHDERVKRNDSKTPRITKKSIMEDVPYPELSIVPLAGKGSLKDFIAQYKVLQTIQMEVLPTNNDLDNNDFFKKLREQNTALGPNTETKLVHHDSNGIAKDQAVPVILAAASQGAYKVDLKGKDTDGATLKGTNESFSYKDQVSEVPESIPASAKLMFDHFEKLTNRGILQGGKSEEDTTPRIKELASKENGKNA